MFEIKEKVNLKSWEYQAEPMVLHDGKKVRITVVDLTVDSPASHPEQACSPCIFISLIDTLVALTKS